MSEENKNMSSIKLFEHKKIRSHWDTDAEKWFFSIVDVIEVLTDSPRPRKYWNALKTKLQQEGSELSHKLGQLKMEAEDGKMRETDVADTEQLFRLIQSIPSPNAEPFKQWLAKTGYERIEESQDPEKTIDRAMENYTNLGYSKEWINQRLKSIEVRKELTDEWESRGVKKGQEFATLTDIITQAWSGKTVKQYKQHKNLKKENLRDNMTNLELVLNMLAEATTKEISTEKKPKNLAENKMIAKQGGTIAGNTRKAIEAKTGKKVVSSQNAKKLITNKRK
jgi:BRO family, N-terminal domain